MQVDRFSRMTDFKLTAAHPVNRTAVQISSHWLAKERKAEDPRLDEHTFGFSTPILDELRII